MKHIARRAQQCYWKRLELKLFPVDGVVGQARWYLSAGIQLSGMFIFHFDRHRSEQLSCSIRGDWRRRGQCFLFSEQIGLEITVCFDERFQDFISIDWRNNPFRFRQRSIGGGKWSWLNQTEHIVSHWNTFPRFFERDLIFWFFPLYNKRKLNNKTDEQIRSRFFAHPPRVPRAE